MKINYETRQRYDAKWDEEFNNFFFRYPLMFQKWRKKQ